MSFSDLGLDAALLRAVSEKSYTTPTPIQARAIPAVLAGRDVLAGAQTGTGKTAAFVLPMLQQLAGLGAGNATPGAHAASPAASADASAALPAAAGSRPPVRQRAPRALVLAPTRELAAQIADSARTYGKYVPVRVQVVFGGVSINPQIDGLRQGCDLLIATPGRLLDLAEQRAADLTAVRTFVLDEADRMLDMGFIRDIRRVMRLLPAVRQNLLFSATYNQEIRELANGLLRDPVTVEVAARNATADHVDQLIYKVPKEHKRHLLAHLINAGNWHQVLVFTRTKHGANRLAQQLEGAGIRTAAIHGNKSQGARVRALSDFKQARITALVATEVAARGLDIKELPQVVNYELPNVPEDYVHRIGRTARAGAPGKAFSLVSPDEAPLLRDIERVLRRSVEVGATPAFQITSMPPAADAAQEMRAGSGRQTGNGARGADGRGARDGRGAGRDHGERRYGGQGMARRDGQGGRGQGGRGQGGAGREAQNAGQQGFRPQRMV